MANPVEISSRGFGALVVLTRTNDTSVYLANDVVGAATGAAAAMEFTLLGPPNAHILIRSVRLMIEATAVISGETSYRLYLYGQPPASVLGDNAPWDLPAADRVDFRGYVDLGTPIDIGSSLYVETNGVNKQLRLNPNQTSLWGYLVTNGPYTPTASRVYRITLQTESM